MSARSSTLIEISNESDGFLFSENGYLKFTPDSKALFAVCQEGTIYKYKYSDSNKLEGMNQCANGGLTLNEMIGMIAVSNSDCVATASESHELVRLYRMMEGNEQFQQPKLVTKCVGSTDALAINPSGTILCCSGKDNIVKVINVKDDEFPVLNQIPMTHFVKAIGFSEDGKQFALLQVDGLLKIFKIVENNPAPQLFKTVIGPKSNMKGKFQISWKQNVLGVLFGGEILRIYDTFEDFKIISEINFKSSILNFELLSKTSALILSEDQNISIYSISRNLIIKSISYENIKNCSVAAANENFACIFDPKICDLFTIKISIDSKDLISTKAKFEEKTKKLKTLKNKKSNKFIDDLAETEDAEEQEGSDIETEEGSDIEEKGSDIEEGESDEELGSEEERDVEFSGDEEEDEDIMEDEPVMTPVKKHPVVQPCCTPFRNLQRYLAYNNVGFITCRQELDEKLYKYDIEFMDRSSHQPIRFEESVSYELAALCERGAVFASKGVGAELKYKSFENSEESWNFPLSLGTEPILVTINSHSIYLVNNRGILNIFSLTGLLRASVTCPGRPVSLTCSEKDEIFMFTEDYEGIMCHRLDSMNGGVVKGSQSSRVLLGSTEKLVWCGTSFSGVLGAFSSNGKFSILLTRGNDRWTEILDTSKSSNGTKAWPVYFDVNTLSSVNCTEEFPDPYPAPIVVDTNFRIPELPTDTFSESYEEIVRTNWILNETSSTGLSEREMKKLFASADRHLLELAQISIKSNRLGRLSDLARWASNEKTVELLIQLAKHHRLVAVVDELENIKRELFSPKPIVSAVAATSYHVDEIANTTFTGSVPTGTTWSTPQLPETVAKESPSGILANLTPMKTATIAVVDEIVSSPAELAPSPSNPFAKGLNNENANPTTAVANEGNAMLDYISAMMKMNAAGGKRKAEDSNVLASKKSTLGSNVFNNNN